jgi:deoxyribose-phosphate aldolase
VTCCLGRKISYGYAASLLLDFRRLTGQSSQPEKTICIRPNFISHALKTFRRLPLRGNTGVCTVIGFHDPSASSLADKQTEALAALHDGAVELDFVINYPLLLETEPAYSRLYTELASLLQAVRESGADCVTKLILETSQLTTPLIVAGCVLAWCAGFDFVKTSTGFNGRGASVEDVRAMRAVCDVLVQRQEAGRSKRMRVKASGGVRTWDDARAMIHAGAERLGVSAGLAIMQGFTASLVEGGGRDAGAKDVQSTSGDCGY